MKNLPGIYFRECTNSKFFEIYFREFAQISQNSQRFVLQKFQSMSFEVSIDERFDCKRIRH